MSFLQSSGWNFTTSYQNPQSTNQQFPSRKASYDISNLSTRKDSTDSSDFKFRYKTEVCKYWVNGEHCPFQSFCSFAHGFVEKRCREDLPLKYKTKICKNWMNQAFCTYGQRCQFNHPQIIRQQQQNSLKHGKALNSLTQNPQLSFMHSKRLRVFNQITDSLVIKDLLGESYEMDNFPALDERAFWNGKARFYSM